MWPCSSLDPRKPLWGAERGRPAPPCLSRISGAPLYSFTSHSRTSAADGRAVGKRRARGKPWAALCQMRLRHFQRDLPANLISRGETACLLTVCRAPAIQQVFTSLTPSELGRDG